MKLPGSLYSATKFGLRGFALCLRADLARSGVGVSIVAPGFIDIHSHTGPTAATIACMWRR